MAILIVGSSECTICGQILSEDDDVVSTTAFIHDRDHPLLRFSDSGMHRKCFLTWEYREDFRALHNEIINEILTNPKIHHYMEANGNVIVTGGA